MPPNDQDPPRLTVARAATWAAIAWSLLILVGTLMPVRGDVLTPGPWCITCGELGGQDFLLNVALFLPLGLALAFTTRPTLRLALIPPAFTLGIELLQLGVIPGRDAALGDLLANSLGGWAGLAIGRLVLAGSRLTAMRRATLLLCGAVVCALTFTTWALLPSGTPRVFTYLQLAPVRPGYVLFDGRVSLTIDGTRLTEWSSLTTDDYPGLAHGLMTGIVHIEREHGGHLGRSLIMRLARSVGPMEADLAQDGRDIVFRSNRNGAELGFRTPGFRAREVLSDSAQVIDVSFTVDSSTVRLQLGEPGPSGRAVPFRVTVARGWEMFSPWGYLPPLLAEALRLAWIPVAFGLVMAGAAACWPGVVAPVAVAAVAAVMTAALPRVVGLSSSTPGETAALATGLLLALGAGRALQPWVTRS